MGYHLRAETAAGPREEGRVTGHARAPRTGVGSGYRYYSPGLGRWVNRDPVLEYGGLHLYGILANDLLSGTDMLGLVEFTVPITWDSGRQSLFLFWIRLQIDGNWRIHITPNAPKDECPDRWPSNIRPVLTVRNYAAGIGVDARAGLQGDDFSMIVGFKVGFSFPADEPWWRRALDVSLDRSHYQEMNARLQIWVPGIQYDGQTFLCVCIAYEADVEVTLEAGLYTTRAGGAAALQAVLLPVLKTLPGALNSPQLPVRLPIPAGVSP